MRITVGHVLLFAVSYACVGIFTRLALDNGANLPAVLIARGAGSALLLWLALLAMRAPWQLPPRDRYRALALGLLLAFSNFCITTAFARIPVPIAVLVLYLFPFITAMLSTALGRERMTPRVLVALVLAFTGLAITVQARIDDYDPVGLAWAAAAAASISVVFIIQTYAFSGGDGRARTLHMLFSTAFVMIVLAMVQGLQLPSAPVGWLSLLGMPVAYVIGLTGMFAAAIALGPGRTALFMNLEPVAAAVLAALVLDQQLTGIQIVGAAIVIGALFLARKK